MWEDLRSQSYQGAFCPLAHDYLRNPPACLVVCMIDTVDTVWRCPLDDDLAAIASYHADRLVSH